MSSRRQQLEGRGFEYGTESHSERAAKLLEKARSASAKTSSPIHAPERSVASRPLSESQLSTEPIALPLILKSLVNTELKQHAFSVKEAIPIAGKLVRAKLNNQVSLSHLNGPVLEEAGITKEGDRHKILVAFGVRSLQDSEGRTSASSKTNGLGGKRSSEHMSKPTTKRKRQLDDEALSREYGNVPASTSEPGVGERKEYYFYEVLDVGALRGRQAYVNRAPIMTAWTTIVLERLGFQRREALSLSHCYVNTTSTSRGISLGIIPASHRSKAENVIGSDQPHFELMGVKIPLMKLGHLDEWRGISQGQIIGPDQAFNYMRKSMYQTLPVVIGALSLLADSYVNATAQDMSAVKEEQEGVSPNERDSSDIPNPELLHQRAYELYCSFRPATAGEWGRKSMFFCDKALALRRGYEDEWQQWQDQHGPGETKESVEQLELQEFQAQLERMEQDGHASGFSLEDDAVKQEE